MNARGVFVVGRRGLLAALRRLALLASSTRVLVEGDSMLPALADGDRLLVSRLAYRFTAPHRGDIVLLRDPSRPGSECIKRIVALPGERVRSEGLSVATSAEEPGLQILPGQAWSLTALEYFVVGDHLAHSRDSRTFGPVCRDALRGKAWYRYASRSGATGPL